MVPSNLSGKHSVLAKSEITLAKLARIDSCVCVYVCEYASRLSNASVHSDSWWNVQNQFLRRNVKRNK